LALACGVSDTFAQDYSAPIPRFLLNKKIFNGPESAVIDGVPSVPLRASAKALGGEVFWDADTMTASVYYDGEVYVCDGALRNDMMMASLDFFKSAFGAQTAYYKNENIIAISAGGDLPSKAEALKLLPTYDGYSEEDLDWLAKIVDAEAKGESYDSKLGVASVIINRKESGQYPETIKGVIFDKKHGVQFTPTLNGTVYNTPSTQSYLVALDALEGRNNASSTLFFLNPKIASSTWVQKNRQYAFTIGGHSYYY
jgi:N-acetylmuramoyl-L-alanine amidase